MKKDFESFYDECLQDEDLFTEWEQVKKKKAKRTKIAITIILIINISIICLLNKNFGIIGAIKNLDFFGFIPCLLMLFGIFMINALIFALFGIGLKTKYSALFKEKIIDNLLKNFFDDVDYIPKKEMPETIYKEPKYEGYYNEYNSDDYMEGMIEKKYTIKMADVETVDVETTTDSEGHTTTTRRTVFSGLFAKIDIEKSIENELKIKQNRTIFKKDRLEMDSIEFEKYFDVSSTNRIVGMQLLTHDIMDLLIDYRIKLNKPFDIIINNNIIYVRLHIGEMFEPKFNKKEFIDKQSVERYYNMVKFIYKLSKKMIDVVNETQI